MVDALSTGQIKEQDLRISEAVERERPRLRSFIRRRVADEDDVEDILQDVFSEFVEMHRLMKPVEQGGCLALPRGPQPSHGPLSQEEAGGTRARTGVSRRGGRWTGLGGAAALA